VLEAEARQLYARNR